jgi:hypothetical protein
MKPKRFNNALFNLAHEEGDQQIIWYGKFKMIN